MNEEGRRERGGWSRREEEKCRKPSFCVNMPALCSVQNESLTKPFETINSCKESLAGWCSHQDLLLPW